MLTNRCLLSFECLKSKLGINSGGFSGQLGIILGVSEQSSNNSWGFSSVDTSVGSWRKVVALTTQWLAYLETVEGPSGEGNRECFI